MLSDSMIKAALEDGRLTFHPPISPEQIQPASVDLTLGDTFKWLDREERHVIDPHDPSSLPYVTRILNPGEQLFLHPGQMVLGATKELITLSPQYATIMRRVPSYPLQYGNLQSHLKAEGRPPLVARVEGRSSLGRLGLMVHITAGFIDPGFSGTITLEFFNAAPYPIKLYEGLKICQLSFFETGYVEKPYQGKYNGQTRPTPSRGI